MQRNKGDRERHYCTVVVSGKGSAGVVVSGGVMTLYANGNVTKRRMSDVMKEAAEKKAAADRPAPGK